MMLNNTESDKYLDILNKITEYNEWATREIAENLRTEKYLKIYRPIIEKIKEYNEKVFLSVVVRTQGDRPIQLREVLLCLYSQTNKNFEVIIVLHKCDNSKRQHILRIIEDQECEFKKKISIIELQDGNRTKPLNMGIAHAKGEYIAVLDDDDLIFDNWVEEFIKKAEVNNGCILHAYVIRQDWERLSNKEIMGFSRAVSAPDDIYCKPYNSYEQLMGNGCPFNSFAFPRALFSECGFIFDEDISIAEDWDYILRVSFFVKIVDIKTPTAIYRWRKGENDSKKLYTQEEWEKNFYSIINKYKKYKRNNELQAFNYAIEELKKKMKSTTIWKTGNTLTFVPRKVKDSLKKKDKHINKK